MILVDFPAGLAHIAPAAVPTVLTEAQNAGRPVAVLSTGDRTGREAFFDAVREALPLAPQLHSSRSWDALADSLWEGIRLDEPDRRVIVWSDAARYALTDPAEHATAVAILRDVADSLRDHVTTSGRPREVSIFVTG